MSGMPRSVPQSAYSRPTSDPGAQSLERCVALLKIDWVWQFFFSNTTPESQQLRYAITSPNIPIQFTTTFLDCPDSRGNVLKNNEKSKVLLLPSFSVGHITIGFILFERKISECTIDGAFHLGRTARNDLDGSFLYIAEHPERGLSELTYFRLHSFAYRERVYLTLHHDLFKIFVQNLKQFGYDHSSFHGSMITFGYIFEARVCPQCNNPITAAPCSCSPRFQTKAHFLDHVTETLNQAMHLGDFRGTSINVCYRLPKVPHVIARIVTECTATPIHDAAVKDHLSQRALFHIDQKPSSSSINALQLTTLQSISAEFTAPLYNFIASMVIQRIKSIRMNTIPLEVSVSSMVPENFLTMITDGNQEAASTNPGNVASNSVAWLIENEQTEFVHDRDDVNLNLYQASTGLPSVSNSDICARFFSDAFNESIGDEFDVTGGPGPSGVDVLDHVSVSMPVTSTRIQVETSAPFQPPCVSTSLVRLPREIPIAPAFDPTSAIPSQSQRVTEQDERRLRTQQRKMKNRESAERSTMRRNMEVARLQKEIDKAMEYEATLRERERQLREENEILKTHTTNF